MKPRLFNKKHIGLHADGACGHDYVRKHLAVLVYQCGDKELSDALGQEMTDDASEEIEALNVLNNNTEDGLSWDFVEGGLMLLVDENNTERADASKLEPASNRDT